MQFNICLASSTNDVHGLQVTGFNINYFNASDFLYPATNVSFVYGPPGKRLPFPDHSFDLAMSMNVLEHVVGAPLHSVETRLIIDRVGYSTF